MTQPLHLMLQRSGVLTPQQLESSVRKATAQKVSLLDLLVCDRRVSEESLAGVFSQWLKVPCMRLDAVRIESDVLAAVPERLARRHTCLPLQLSGKDLMLAMANPLDVDAIRDVQVASHRFVKAVVGVRSEILDAIDRHYVPQRARVLDTPGVSEPDAFAPVTEQRGDLNLDEPHPEGGDGQPPAVGICDLIVREAIALRASDIHIEPEADGARVRLRVDGVLRSHLEIPRWLLPPVVSRIKILAKLDIATQRLPQDGRISVIYQARRSNIRVSTLPTHFGEKIVLRLLGAVSVPGLDELGMPPEQVTMLSDAVAQPQGLVLVTGPTGAGKSTTLYSMLAQRSTSSVNIVTIEDPIEYQVDGITQVQVDAKAGLTFAKSLRAILRQDPNVILVGEIRDLETAEVAFQAALTGHLVLTTLHTNSTVAAITRLLDLGLKPALITEATSVVVAQRLARRVCDGCRTAYRPHPDVLRKLRLEADGDFWHGAGCAQCAHTGYAGRIGIFEILRLTRPLKAVLKRQAGDAEIARTAREAVTGFLLEDALIKLRAGLTTAEEVARVLRIERDDEGLPDAAASRRGSRARKSGIPRPDPSRLLDPGL